MGHPSKETHELYGDTIEQLVKLDPFVTLGVLMKESKTTMIDVWHVFHNRE
ncbi:hypothetical protein IWQ62_004658 [Dispira parvispora]|uniref:Uncharacterized protein n=1 Tax=Dispira parvispora TaxID=1520584 RepID=A0A9W8E5E8_9FUNG|nr:hypothetical protein IWQ62_004658 [Dispira parvispora]